MAIRPGAEAQTAKPQLASVKAAQVKDKFLFLHSCTNQGPGTHGTKSKNTQEIKRVMTVFDDEPKEFST